MRFETMRVAIVAVALLLPSLAWAGNQEIAQGIAAQLRNSGQLSNYDIKIKYEDGTAWLHGRVTNKEQLNKALVIARQVPGVHRVINELSIEPVAQITPIPAVETQPVYEAAPVAVAELPPVDSSVEPAYNTAPQPGMTASPIPVETVNHQPQAAPAAQPVAHRTVRQAQPRIPAQPVGYPIGGGHHGHHRGPAAMGMGAMPAGGMPGMAGGYATPTAYPGFNAAPTPMYFDQPHMPNYAWPSYAAYPNYAAVTYPRMHSPTAWPYIGPFYPYPQVPLGWRRVTLEWDDGWWMLDFDDRH